MLDYRAPPAVLDAITRTDFYSFIQAFFPIVSGGESLLLNWHLEAMAYALTRVMNGEVRRLIITLPPRHLKSICASVAFPAFLLGHDPARRIICVSYSDQLARKHANDCRALMRSVRYRSVFPGARLSLDKDSETEFMTTRRGFRLATSVGGTLTGRGGNLIVIDDPMKPQDAHSETMRENVKQWYGNTLISRLDNKTLNPIVVVMQRLHSDDFVGYLIEQEGWTVMNLPAIAETEQTIMLGHNRVFARPAQHVLHSARESRGVLNEIRRSMGSVDFAAQYQQTPVPPSGNMVDWSWFKFFDEAPACKPGDRFILSWDTALSPSELSDYSVCMVLQIRKDTVWVLDLVRGRFDYPTLKRRAIQLHRQWSPIGEYRLVIENKGSGMSLIQDLINQNIYPIRVQPSGDKVMRMHAQTARIESGSVFLPRRAAWLDDFRTELLAFPRGRHDDQVDALSQGLDRAFNYQPPQAASGTFAYL